MSRIALIALLIFAMSSSDDRLNQLAASGRIQENAPVRASLEIAIDAPPERVWALLTEINNWPKWQQDITKAEISGPLQSGTGFSWTSGAHIRSRIALVQPLEAFAWTGTAYGAKAIHVWKLQRLPGGKTLVKTDESMDGFLLTLFFSSKKLEETDRRWLNYLKAAAEI
jgi:uncharacterized protein YndB with AHSA1/START domain